MVIFFLIVFQYEVTINPLEIQIRKVIKLDNKIEMVYLHPSGCSSVNSSEATTPFSTSKARFKMFSVRSNSALGNRYLPFSNLFSFKFVKMQSNSEIK